MSNTPNRATNPAGKPRKKDTALDLTTARQMLPLVQSIVSDIVTTRQAISQADSRAGTARTAPPGSGLARTATPLPG